MKAGDEVLKHLAGHKAEIESGTMTLSVHARVAWVTPDHLPNHCLAPADIPIAEAMQGKVHRNLGE